MLTYIIRRLLWAVVLFIAVTMVADDPGGRRLLDALHHRLQHRGRHRIRLDRPAHPAALNRSGGGWMAARGLPTRFS